MKTTLVLDDAIVTKLKREAARQGRTMSELVESALRLMFQERRDKPELPPLPTHNFGEWRVDITDREALYEVLDADRDARLYGTRKKK